jgi:methylase of polypeptide subunit release factors
MVDFGELEARHFPTIKKSLQENQTSDVRYRLIQTDVWSNLPAQAGITDRHDYIFANPPYLEKTNEKETLLKDEPPEALFAGDGGFALIEKTLRGAREHLNPGGQLWLEHEPGQSARIAALSAELGLTSETHPDQFGVDRYTVAYCRT